jgi:hypothetical protein
MEPTKDDMIEYIAKYFATKDAVKNQRKVPMESGSDTYKIAENNYKIAYDSTYYAIKKDYSTKTDDDIKDKYEEVRGIEASENQANEKINRRFTFNIFKQMIEDKIEKKEISRPGLFTFLNKEEKEKFWNLYDQMKTMYNNESNLNPTNIQELKDTGKKLYSIEGGRRRKSRRRQSRKRRSTRKSK